MPLHFKKSERAGRATRRIFQKLAGSARHRLRGGTGPQAVHHARQDLKRMRALLRLVRGEMNAEEFHKAMKQLRRTAASLAAARDARVRLQALKKISGRAAAKNFPKILKALEQRERQETHRCRRKSARAIRRFRKSGQRADRWKIHAADWTALGRGLIQSYTRGQTAHALARRAPTPKHFHAWRRRVKDFSFQLELLCPDWPKEIHLMQDGLDRLGEQLGDMHDLDLLAQFAAVPGRAQAKEAAALKRLIAARQKRLRGSALRLGRRLFAEGPGKLMKRLQAGWTAWRGEK